MKLRVVDIGAWINGTNDNPQGVYFHDLPEGWDELDETARTGWVSDRIAEITPPAERGVGFEFGDFVDGEWQAVAGSQRSMVAGGPVPPTEVTLMTPLERG